MDQTLDADESETLAGADSRGDGMPPHHQMLAATRLFEGITAAQLHELGAVCRERCFAPNDLILREGAPDPFVYVLVDGVARLVKNTSLGGDPVRMAEFRSGAVLGELKIVDPKPSSATIVAVTQVTAVEIDLAGFARANALTATHATVVSNVGRILAARLRTATDRGADAMQRELDEARARAYAGRFIILMFVMLAIYQLVIAAVTLVPQAEQPPLAVLTMALVIWAAIPVILSLRRTPFLIESYGLTTRGAGHVTIQALVWTLPLLLLLLAGKLASMRWLPSMAGRPLFDLTALLPGREFNIGLYTLAVVAYAIHSPLQELVARAGLQGTLQHFVPVAPGRTNWQAIIIANLLFAVAHAFISFWFSLAVFIPGLFWGWMFAKQRSLIGVTVSHFVTGFWAIFVLGVTVLFGDSF